MEAACDSIVSGVKINQWNLSKNSCNVILCSSNFRVRISRLVIRSILKYLFHYKMEGHGQTNYARILFTEIEPFSVLAFKLAFVDEEMNIIPAPFPIKFPLEVLYNFKFSESEGKTTMTMTGTPVNATPEQLEGFAGLHESMQQGFGASFGQLAIYLSAVNNK